LMRLYMEGFAAVIRQPLAVERLSANPRERVFAGASRRFIWDTAEAFRALTTG